MLCKSLQMYYVLSNNRKYVIKKYVLVNNGFLTQWTEASNCDQDCGPGIKIRYRTCNDICPSVAPVLGRACNIPTGALIQNGVEVETVECPEDTACERRNYLPLLQN